MSILDEATPNFEINYSFFDSILNNADFTDEKMTAFAACRLVYERTYMNYGMKFIEKKFEADKLTQTVIQKVAMIDELETKIMELQNELDPEGTRFSKEDKEATKPSAFALSLH